MLMLLMSIALGVPVGLLAGWLLRSAVRLPAMDVVAGGLGALAAAAAWPRLAGAGVLPLGTTIAAAAFGALVATFVAHLVMQARQPASVLLLSAADREPSASHVV
jgi:hypothetical protein